MWFAALGHYQHNPWLLHLLYKIVASPNPRDDPALALLDVDAYPFDDVRRPALVRASLYHYDFTRVPSPWARALPGAALLDAACNPFRTANDSKCDAYALPEGDGADVCHLLKQPLIFWEGGQHKSSCQAQIKEISSLGVPGSECACNRFAHVAVGKQLNSFGSVRLPV